MNLWQPTRSDFEKRTPEYYGFTEDCDARAWIYFLDGGDLIKIGTTNNLTTRIADLRRMCPVPLELVLVIEGNRHIEAMIHQQFDHLRQYGEWFEKGDDLLEAINDKLAQYQKYFDDISEGFRRYPGFQHHIEINAIGYPLKQKRDTQ